MRVHVLLILTLTFSRHLAVNGMPIRLHSSLVAVELFRDVPHSVHSLAEVQSMAHHPLVLTGRGRNTASQSISGRSLPQALLSLDLRWRGRCWLRGSLWLGSMTGFSMEHPPELCVDRNWIPSRPGSYFRGDNLIIQVES